MRIINYKQNFLLPLKVDINFKANINFNVNMNFKCDIDLKIITLKLLVFGHFQTNKPKNKPIRVVFCNKFHGDENKS